MLFVQISLTALLFFIANVSSAPLHEPVARGQVHAGRTALPDGQIPALQAHGKEKYPQAVLAAAQVIPGGAALAHIASHMQIHASPPESPDDLPTLQYARSPTTIAKLRQAYTHAINAHHAAATAHLDAAAHLWGSDNARAQHHSAEADRHEKRIHAHQSRLDKLVEHSSRDSASGNEMKDIHKETAAAHASAKSANAEAAHAAATSAHAHAATAAEEAEVEAALRPAEV